MKHSIALIAFFTITLNAYCQKKGVIKADFSGVPEYNFYQLGYEFNIQDNSSIEIGLGFGSEPDINLYGVSIQSRYYLNQTAPEGFHLGPRVLAVYAQSKDTSWYNGKPSAFGFEIDGILGHQFIIGNSITLDPYIGGGVALVDNQAVGGFIWGITLGVCF
ncbi:hypothetical protein GSB9_00805 [Flavobacteriaceae bacterium GSB9]|nr:hypothetical protein GSB9_00805 [Flavobacteriaceae bacterium GSB9]